MVVVNNLQHFYNVQVLIDINITATLNHRIFRLTEARRTAESRMHCEKEQSERYLEVEVVSAHKLF